MRTDLDFGVTNDEQKLRKFCHVATGENDDIFVGLKFDKGMDGSNSIKVCFPYGYHLSNNEVELKQDIQKLLRLLSIFSCRASSQLPISNIPSEHFDNFPVEAYLALINDFFQSGGAYFYDRLRVFKNSKIGKIDWGKTIKLISPNISRNNVVYLDYIVRDSEILNNQIITEIHKHCVHISFKNLGWIFCDFVPPDSFVSIGNNESISLVKKYLFNCHNDRSKNIFSAMLKILVAESNTLLNDVQFFGTFSFEHVWEWMIDKVFGIQTNKSDYFPRAIWHIKNRESKLKHALIPDSIMIFKDQCYVLDAKYYRFGMTGQIDDLPDSSDVNKQITYGRYIMIKNQVDPFNAFIFPFDFLSNGFDAKNKIENIGYCVGNWEDGFKGSNNFNFSKIQGILFDTKLLVDLFFQREDESSKSLLSSAIKNNLM